MADDWEPPTGPDQELAHHAQIALKGAFAAAAQDAIDAYDLPLSFDWIDPAALEYASARGAELVGMKLVDGQLVENPNAEWAITDTTREEIRDLLGEALKDGDSIEAFASRLEEAGIFSEDRAELVARNEIANSMIGGKLAAYAEADIEYGYVYDGDYDEECQARDGTIIPMEDFELLHPNCEADIRPATQQELIDEGLIDAETEQEDAA